MRHLLFISSWEIFIVLLVVVLLFGADKIPEIARGLGRGIRQVKDATNSIKKEITDSAKKQGIDTDILKDVTKEIDEVKEGFENINGPVKRNR